MSIDALLSKLDKVKKTGDGRWMACCPAHEDRSASLSIRETENGLVLVHDFAGCSVEQVLGAVGLELEELFPPRPIEHARREHRPFPAADVLHAVADELYFVLVFAGDLKSGKPLNDADHARLIVAIERVHAARELALGR